MAKDVEENFSIHEVGREPVYHIDPILPQEVVDGLIDQALGRGKGSGLPQLPVITIPRGDFLHYSTISGQDASIGTPDPEPARTIDLGQGVKNLGLRGKQFLSNLRPPKGEVLQVGFMIMDRMHR